jgi:hypothetical protein
MKYSARSRHYLSLILLLAMSLSYLPVSAHALNSRAADSTLASPDSTLSARSGASQTKAVDPATEQRLREAYGKLPVSFEPNLGQLDRRVKFTARGGGYTMFLTATETVFVMRGKRAAKPASAPNAVKQPRSVGEFEQQITERHEQKEASRNQELASRSVVRMKLSGSNEDPAVMGMNELPGKVNHFSTNDSKKWATDVPLYSKVQYKSVYPGIDMVYHSGQQQLEYDFVVAPGVDPSVIALSFEGADRVEVNPEGDLLIQAQDKVLRQQKPAVYQEINGKQQAIESRFVMKGNQVGFQLGSYDAARPLIIDPVLTYSTFLGDEENDDNGFDITVDSDGNAYVVGQTLGEVFPTEDPLQSVNADANFDAFVTKFNPAGSALIYSTYLGGTADEAAYSVALDSDRNIYLTGYTDSVDFPRQNAMQQSCGSIVPGYFSLLQCEEDEAFVTKIAAAGNHLLFSTYLGGSAPDRGRGIAVDSSNNVYVTGFTYSFNFPTTHAIQPFLNNASSLQASRDACCKTDAFLTKLEPGGQFRVYSTFIGGAQDDVAMDIAVDSSGNAYLTGFTDSTEFDPTADPAPSPTPKLFPTTPGAFQSQPSGKGFTREAFVTKVNAAGSGYVFSTLIGGNSEDEAYGIALGPDNSPYITGYTDSSLQSYPTTETAYQQDNRGGYDAFITRFTPDGSAILYSSLIGGERDEGQGVSQFLDDNFDGAAIAVDFAGNAYITGWTDSTTVAPSSGPPPCAASFNFTDFSSITGLTLNGSAAQSGDVLQLTPDANNQNGSAFYTTPVNGSANFTTTFGFKITVTDEQGSEGFAFNLTNDGANTLPSFGEYGTTSDFSVALQTYDTGNTDTLRIFYQGAEVATADVTALNLDDGNAHTETVDYTGGVVSVKIDGASSPTVTATVDLSAISPSTYVGFSARTGGDSETPGAAFREAHDILSWSFSGASTCLPPVDMSARNFPTKNAVQPNPGSAPGDSSRDAFVAKFNTTGAGPESLIYSTFLGGILNDEGQGIAVDVAANAYVTGKTGTASEGCGCPSDIKSAKGSLSATGSSVTASAGDNNFPTTPGSFNPSKSDESDGTDQDAFVTKIGGGAFVAHDTDTGFSIAGLVTRPDGAGVSNVTITVKRSDNTTAGATSTDANGLYFVDYLAPGVYTVTPSGGSDANSFSPLSRSVTIINQNERADFTATALFIIKGQVTENGTGMAGVVITLSGSTSATTTTDQSGNYQFSNLLAGGNYTVTPSSPFFTFTPPSKTFNNLSGHQPNTDFAATRLSFSFSGRVLEGGAGLGGVTISVVRSIDNLPIASATTASDGTYTATGLPAGGNYTVTPSLAFYAFMPPSRSITTIVSNQTNFDFAATRQHFAIAGRIATASNNLVGGVTVTLSGDAAATATTDINGEYTFPNLVAGHNYVVTPAKPNYTFSPPSRAINNLVGNQQANFTAIPAMVTFTAAAAPGGAESTRLESDGSFHVTVNRTGDASGELLVEYATFDGPASPTPSPAPSPASERSDYITSIGRLRFAPGETTKTITIFIVDDAFVEGNEALSLVLTSPSNGGTLGNTAAVTLTIVDNDTVQPTRNPIDDPAFFVHQQYLDFLNREPDVDGFAGWVATLAACPPGNPNCDRISVSSAFFRSEEFQGRSFFVYRFYSTALGRIPHYREMMRDLSLVTGFLSDEELEANKQQFVADFTSRPEFKNRYDAVTDPAAYVNALLTTAGVTVPNKQQLIDDLAAGRMTRGQVLRAIAESQEVKSKYYNQAFVVTEYFGYLRRDPDILYLDWINTLNQTGDYRRMVDGFMNSLEYRRRFGPSQ